MCGSSRMKSFDVEVGNPPFSPNAGKSNVKLYQRFFADMCERAEVSAFIMPYDPAFRSRKFRQLLHRHTIGVSEDVSRMFPNVGCDIRIHISRRVVDRARYPIPPELGEPVIDEAMPERERIKAITGFGAIRKDASRKPLPNSTMCLGAINAKGPVYVWVDNAILDRAPDHCLLHSDWAVVIGRRARVNGMNAVKWRNTGKAFFSRFYAYAVEARDEADADALLAWITSPEFYALAKPLLEAYGGIRKVNVNLDVLERLPMHRGRDDPES